MEKIRYFITLLFSFQVLLSLVSVITICWSVKKITNIKLPDISDREIVFWLIELR